MIVRVRRAALLACLVGAWALRADTQTAVETRLRRDITFLASAECEGRGVHTQGINQAADYIVEEFKKAGLKPGVAQPNPGYFQPFTITGEARQGQTNTLSLRGPLGQQIELRLGTDFQPLNLSGKGKVSAPVVFVGYGVSAEDLNYDDYRGADVAGKVVIVLRKTPRPDNALVPFGGGQSAFHASLETKLVKADLQKAAAVLFVNDAVTAGESDPLVDFKYAAGGSPAQMPTLHVRRRFLEAMTQASLGRTLGEIEQDINRTLQPRSATLAGWTADLDVGVERPAIPVKNVVGVLEGSGRLAHETVVVGAHYDHLGFGSSGTSLARDRKPAIHHGADDNASGTTALLELARRYGQRPAEGDRRRLVFIAFSAEEIGLIGSIYYCKNPPFPLESTVGMVNLDMVGRLRPDDKTGRDKLYVEGSGSAKHFDELLDQFARKHAFDLVKKASGNGPSDHASFYAKNVPVIFYWTGYHADYHKPTDTADKINIAGMRKIVDLSADTITHLAAAPTRPEYVFIAPPKAQGGMRAGGPRLGIVPSYSDEADGVVLDGVSEGGPAAKGGLKAGDRIVSLAGQPVRNINSYMVLMGGRKKGETIDVVVVRAKEKVTVKVTLE